MSDFMANILDVPKSVIDLLSSFPANGKPAETNALHMAREAGLVAKHEVKKCCPTCGTRQTDYTYLKPTKAGRWLLRLAQGMEAPKGVETTGSTEGDSPVTK